MGTQPHSPRRGRTSPIYGPFLLWPNGLMHQDATSYGARPQPRGLCVRWGHSPLPKKGAQPPKFSAHVYCGQTAGWIKMALDMEVGLSPGDFVLDGDPAHTPKGAEPHPIFGPRLLRPNGCMDQDATWYAGSPHVGLREIVFDVDPATPRKKGTPTPPNFWPISIVAK